MIDLTPNTLLSAYAQGIFPMTDQDGQTRWYSADPRGIIPLDGLHIPHTLGQIIRQGKFDIRIDHDFEQTMQACARNRREGTWIGPTLIRAYCRLHSLGFAHSVEAWRGNELAGGLYGVSLGGAFFGESMFHRQRDASKVALVHLVHRLRDRGFQLLDTQSATPHLKRLGCVEIAAEEYLRRLDKALQIKCVFV